jgi:alanyl-tRNA synthetase
LQQALSGAAQDQVTEIMNVADEVNGAKVASGVIETSDSESLRAFGDRMRDRLGSGVGVVVARVGERHAMLAVVTDDLIGKGLRADAVVREIAKLAGGKGGGRPHMAQASIGEPEKAEKALAKVLEIVRPMIEQAKA